MKSHTIVCRNCKKTVARTPNKKCISCGMPKWGYGDADLEQINNPKKQAVQKFVCKNCDNTVVRTPINKCHVCSMPFWGYTEFELDQGLVNLVEAVPTIKKATTQAHEQKPVNFKKVTLISLLGLLVLSVVYLLSRQGEESILNYSIGSSYARDIEEVQKAVAFIKFANGTATGFLVSNKYILTAGHVACDKNEFEVIFTKSDEETRGGELVHCALIPSRTDFDYFERDFALIEISPIRDIKPLRLGNSDDVEVLDDVYTAGHPLGDVNLSLTEGDINSLKYGGGSFDLFKHTIASNPGNSGGPIIKKSTGEVVAILVGGRGIMLTRTDLIIPQGENIGVKINTVKNVLRDYLE